MNHSCSYCRQSGHNKRTCPDLRTEADSANNELKKITKKRLIEDLEQRYPGIEQRFKEESNAQIARVYGLSRERIRQLRVAYGIPKSLKMHQKVPSEVLGALGKVSDGEIARMFPQYTRSKIFYVRRVKNIEAAPKQDRFSCLEPIRDRLGTLSDRQLAREMGVTVALVFDYRQKLGIPPFRKSPRSKDFEVVNREKIKNLFLSGHSDKFIATDVGSTPASVAMIRRRDLKLFRKDKDRSQS